MLETNVIFYRKMFLPAVDSYSVKIVTFSCVFTCIYLPLLVLFLIYFNQLYLIGTFTCIYVPGLIIVAEVLKLCLTCTIEQPTVIRGQRRPSYLKLKLKEVYKSAGCVLMVTLMFYVLAVLFGAPIFSKMEETLMLSMLVASMTVVPSCMNVGADQTMSFLIGRSEDGFLLNDMIVRYIQFTILGTWLGAIVIPLDWDRPWQEWPISCAVGAMSGHLFAHVVMLVRLLPNIIKVFTGRTFKFLKCCSRSKSYLNCD